ncbi:MauE/DoxX family redox-associated membrane protein [Leeuwenhoekiella sp. H156]|uniref:MauE/DoxX family redox-associated membrane protein n=1 Tax=Leeuwenhoekiella sp. H156 TaxID=3450128 RepID=UPI003FA4A93F
MQTLKSQSTNINLGISLALSLLWMYAATAKVIEFDQFKIQMSQVGFLKPFAGVLAWIIPFAEYSLAALLLISGTRRLGLIGSAVLMSVFTVYIAGMISFSPQLPCSCGGIINNLTWQQHLIFNLLFTGLAYWGCYRFKHFKITNI